MPKAVSELMAFPKVKFNGLLFVGNVLRNTRYFFNSQQADFLNLISV